MQPHQFLDDDLRESAALYVLDSLEPEEARVWRLHLVQCDVCRNEVDSLARSARDLALIAPAEMPPPELWDRVIERVRSQSRPQEEPAAQVWQAWTDSGGHDAAGFRFVDGAESGFEPTGFEGVEARRLFVDRDHDRVTMLVRMRAGSRYPGHVHAGPEECYVLAGDLRVGDLHMHAGDFQRAGEGSTHPVQSTDHGCVLLLTSSLNDRLT